MKLFPILSPLHVFITMDMSLVWTWVLEVNSLQPTCMDFEPLLFGVVLSSFVFTCVLYIYCALSMDWCKLEFLLCIYCANAMALIKKLKVNNVLSYFFKSNRNLDIFCFGDSFKLWPWPLLKWAQMKARWN